MCLLHCQQHRHVDRSWSYHYIYSRHITSKLDEIPLSLWSGSRPWVPTGRCCCSSRVPVFQGVHRDRHCHVPTDAWRVLVRLSRQNIFTKELISNLEALNIPDFSSSHVVNWGAISVRAIVSKSVLPEVRVVYDALVKISQLALILGCLSIIGAMGIEWKSIKTRKVNERAH